MSEERPTIEEVKRALAALTTEEPMAKSRAVIETGADAIEDFHRAATFSAAGGLARLSRAIELAERADDRRLLREGQRVLAAFERFRDAAGENPNWVVGEASHGRDLLEETKRGDR